MADFPTRLKELREEINLSKKKLAAFIDVSEMAIGRWETKKRLPRLDYVIKLADYFKVSLDYMVGKED